MSKLTKRITAMLLAGMLVLGSVPGSVLAASTDVDQGQASEISEEVYDGEISEASVGEGETAEIAEETSETPAAAGGTSMESYPEEASAEEEAAVQFYTITLDANGGYFENEWDDAIGDYARQAEVVEKHIPIGGTVAAFPVFNDPNGQTMVFAGWGLERDGELVSQAEEEYSPIDNCTLYAVWQTEDADKNVGQEDTTRETDAEKESEDSEAEEESEAAQGYEETEAVEENKTGTEDEEEAEVAQEFEETAEDGDTAQETGNTNEDTDEYAATETDNEQDAKPAREVIYSDGVEEENKEEAETSNKNTNSSREDYNIDSDNGNSEKLTGLSTKKEEKPSNVNEDSSEVIIDEGEEEGIVTNRLFGAVSTPTDGNRYTVLLLDNSGSMSGKPLTTEKEAAKKFCSQMLASDGVNYISIVTYASSVLSANSFNKEIDDLSNQINNMTASGGTNTNAAIKQAILLLNQVPDSATKNIVLLSDGIPESGETLSSGRYNSSDNSYYAYGNAVYETAKSIDNAWNFYSLGFFYDLSGNDLTFARKLMSDLPGDPSMYYEVTDVDDLEFVFGKVVQDITQSDLKKLYIDQHLNYINSSQYTDDIIPGFGQSLTQILLDVRNDSAVSGYNFCSNLSDALGYELDLTQEYELLLANLMVNEQTYNGVKDAYLTNYHDEINKATELVTEALDEYTDASQAVDRNRAIELFNSLLKEDYLSDKYCELYEEYKDVINNEMTTSQVKTVLSKLSPVLDMADIVFSSAAETIEYYCRAKAYLDTTNDFIYTLIILDWCAENNAWASNIDGVEPLTQLFELSELQMAIENFIESMENYKTNNAWALATYFSEEVSSRTAGKMADKASDLMFSQIPIFNTIPYLKKSLEAGLSVVDIFSDLDERAAAGNMVEKLYIMTALMDEVSSMFESGFLADYNDEKTEDDIFRDAAVFDESVNLYKTALKLAADYGIEYEEFLLKNESEKILPSKRKMSWYSAAISLANVEKLRADNILCHHEGIQYNHKSDIVLDSNKLKIFTIACPVAVEVKDESGTRVAYLADNTCEVADGYSPYFYTVQNANNDCIKVATIPDDSRYTISITGLGNGSMNAYLGKYDGTEINGVKEYSGIIVNENSFGYFGEEDTNGFENLIFDGVEYDKDNEHKGYYMLSTEAGDGAAITVNKYQFYCANNQTLMITAKIQTPSAFLDGSRKYTGYLAMLQNWSWIQLGAWYIDGGTIVVDLPINLTNISTGNKTFTISLFESDNFTTGASLYDCMFKVNILPECFELTFDANGGTCATESKAITYGLAYGELPIPQRSGYTFGGWFTDKDGKQLRITASNTVEVLSDQILYAAWRKVKPRTIMVTYDANGGICRQKKQLFREGDSYDNLPIPVKTGNLFVGWYTERSGGSLVEAKTKAVEGTLYAHWRSLPITFDECVINLAQSSFIYDGTKKTPAVSVKDGKYSLKNGTDYTVTYINNTNVGTATVKITGKGNYTGTVSKTFKINGIPVSNATVTGISNKTYTGSAITQNPTVKVGNKTLKKGADYTISYANNTNVGTATVTFTGKGNYASKKTATFKINKAAQSISAKVGTSKVAIGKATTVSITGNKGKKSYKSSNTAIATVTSAGKVTAKKVGAVKITATSAATSNYNAASKTVTIKVVPAATASLAAANQATGIMLTWKKVTGANGYKVYRGSTLIKTLTSGSTVTFADTKANTNGTKYTYKVVAKATTGDSTLSKSVAVYRVARPAISSATNSAASKMTVKWGKNAKANGYQIQYSLSSSFGSGNKAVTITSASTVSRVIGSLTKGKTYYIRIRTYKTVGSTKYWSEWSAKKSVKISK